LVSRILTTEILPNEFYVSVLCVNSNYRRQGIGENLIKNATKIAKDKKCSRMILDVTKENYGAIKFYEKNGFRIYDEVNTSFLFNKINVYKMELPLKNNILNE
jgi:ribosomal protein S18 acetylase RimI-like enzyme